MRLTRSGRLLWVWLSHIWRGWRSAIFIVKPETVLTWHRRGFRLLWTWKSRHRPGRPAVRPDVRALIRIMPETNPLWGAPRIHGELLKLGIDVSQATIARYMARHLRTVAFAHQTTVYGVLMRSAAAALLRLAADPRYVGARLGCLAVLHTWTRAMLYHPHVHLLVTAGGLSADGTQWIAPKNPAFLVPVQALSVIFRAKVCAGLRRAGLLDQASPAVWTTPWVVHAQPAGRGQRVLDYLGRYVFRVAIAQSRLEAIDHGQVTFAARQIHEQERRFGRGRYSAVSACGILPARAPGGSGSARRGRGSPARGVNGASASWRSRRATSGDPPLPRGARLPCRRRDHAPPDASGTARANGGTASPRPPVPGAAPGPRPAARRSTL